MCAKEKMENIHALLEVFQTEIRIQYAASLEGNYKLNNKSVDRSHRIFQKLRALGKAEALLALLDSPHPEVRVSAAVYCLPLAEHRCLLMLAEIKEGKYPLLSLGAEYSIKNWLNKEYYLWDD